MGDEPNHDVAAAQSVGMQGLLIDHAESVPPAFAGIRSLAELPRLLSAR